MNRDELDKRNKAAITHWSVTMRDMAKVPQGLLDDLARIADEHAAERKPVPAQPPGSGFSVAVHPGVITSDPDMNRSTGEPPILADADAPSARTRTRTRRNTP